MDIEAELGSVADAITQTRRNVMEASQALDAAENKCTPQPHAISMTIFLLTFVLCS